MYTISSNNIININNSKQYFTVKLESDLKPGDYQLSFFAVTNQLYNVIDKLNNIFYIEIKDIKINDIFKIEIKIPQGYYTIGDLLNGINNSIKNALMMNYKNHYNITATYSNTSGKLTFKSLSNILIKLVFEKKYKTNILLGFRKIISNFLDEVKSDNVIDLFHLNTFVGVTIKESFLKHIKLSNGDECNWIFPMTNGFQNKIIYTSDITVNPTLKIKKKINIINMKFQNQDGILLKNIDQWTIILKKK